MVFQMKKGPMSQKARHEGKRTARLTEHARMGRGGGGAAHADGNGVARDGYIGPVVTGLERTILETDDAGEDDAEGPRDGRRESSYRLQQATKDTDGMEMKLKVRKKKRITGAGRDAMRLGADSQMVLCGVGTPANAM